MAALKKLSSPPKKLYITRQAIGVIQAEARSYHASDGLGHETGGILIGRRLQQEPDAILIVLATGPGPKALRNPLSFEPDIDYVNAELDQSRAIYPQIDYIGTWHKHPPGLPRFSPGDVATAHAAFNDPDYKMQELINPIVTVDRQGDVAIQYYYMSRNMAQLQRDFIDLAHIATIIDEDNELVRRERPSQSFVAATSARAQPRTLPWMRKELQQLDERGYAVDIHHDQDHYYFLVRLPDHPGLVIYIITAQDYPQSDPDYYSAQNGVEHALNKATISGQWHRQAHRTLESLVEVILDQIDVARNQLTSRAPLRSRGRTNDPPSQEVVGELSLASIGELTFGNAAQIAGPAVAQGEYDAQVAIVTAPPRKPVTRRSFVVGTIGALLTLIGFVIAGFVFTMQQQASQIADSYAARWALIDAAQTEASIGSLRTAEAELLSIQSSDPSGTSYKRNNEVSSTMALLALQIEQLSQTAQAQSNDATLRAVWQPVEDEARLAEKIGLIEGLRAEGITQDPAGVSVGQRLHDARLSYARLLTEQGDWSKAQAILQSDLQENTDLSAAARQEAADLLAASYISQGDAARDAKRLLEATSAYAMVLMISPRPNQQLVDEAQTEGDAIKQQVIKENEINLTWAEFNTALQQNNFDLAVRQLDAIVNSVGLLPDPAIYGVVPYDVRTVEVGVIRAETRLGYAVQLGRQGKLDAARKQNEAVGTELGMLVSASNGSIASQAATLSQRLQGDSGQLDQAEQLWSTYNSAFSRGAWTDARRALQSFELLPNFGSNALNPTNGRSVKTLLDQVNARLNPPTQAPVVPTAINTLPPPPSVVITTTGTPEPTLIPNPPEPMPTPVPLPTPIQQIAFQVVFTTITEEEMRSLQGGAICEGCNGFLAEIEPGVGFNVSSNGANAQYSSANRIMRLGEGQITINVVSIDGSIPLVFAQQNRTIQVGTFYRVTVSRVN